MDLTHKINWTGNRRPLLFVNSLQNQIKWFLANTWNETFIDAAPSVAKKKKADTGCIVKKETIPVLQICKHAAQHFVKH